MWAVVGGLAVGCMTAVGLLGISWLVRQGGLDGRAGGVYAAVGGLCAFGFGYFVTGEITLGVENYVGDFETGEAKRKMSLHHNEIELSSII